MLKLFRLHWKILAPCFVLFLLTGIGQTFLLAQFIPYLSLDFNMNRTEISTIYSLATLIAAFNLPSIGKYLDKLKIKSFTLIVSGFIILGLIILGIFPQNVLFLLIGFYLLRGFGQMGLGLIGSNILGKTFGMHRGKAMAVTSLGRSLGEGILPAFVLFLVFQFGYRSTFLILALIFFIIMGILAFYVLPSLSLEPLYPEKKNKEGIEEKKIHLNFWGKFWFFKAKWPLLLMILGSLVPFAVTGLFFHQESVLIYKNWTKSAMIKGFFFFSLFHILGNICWGYLIDRFRASTIFPMTFIPFMLTMMVLLFLPLSYGPNIYMGMLGMSVGLCGMMRNTLWPELLELKYLGQIKATDGLFLVLGTSISPIFVGKILDMGVPFYVLPSFFILFAFLGMILHFWLLFYFKKIKKGPVAAIDTNPVP